MRFPTAAASLVVVAFISVAPAAQDAVDADIVWQIRREATDRSQILRTLHVLTDRYGPRLTGSPNLRGAQDWIAEQGRA